MRSGAAVSYKSLRPLWLLSFLWLIGAGCHGRCWLSAIYQRVAVGVGPLDNLGVADLARTAFTAQLPHDFHLMIPAHDVSLGKQAAVGVHGQRAAEFDAPVLREGRGLAGLAQAEALECNPR